MEPSLEKRVNINQMLSATLRAVGWVIITVGC